MARIQGIRWTLEFKQAALYPERGVGIVTYGGCLGSEYGDDRLKMFRAVKIVLGWWRFVLCANWRREANRG